MAAKSVKSFSGHPGAGNPRKYCVLPVFLASVFVPPLLAQSNITSICLTNARQVRELDPETAGKNLPVHMSGVVTYYDAPLFNLFFQDATAGIFVLVAPDVST